MTLRAIEFANLQADLTRKWHDEPATPAPSAPDHLRLAGENHRRNFDLWHTEDEARRNDLGPDHVCQAKRAIDKFNQQRNDFIQQMDEWLIHHLRPPGEGCPLNSETPGMMIDRLSILALKSYHMGIEANRVDASATHRENAAKKVAVLDQQIRDLTGCLQALFDDIAAGRRTFKVYFQFKMYNDPTLNPALYGKK
jgi:hypothetical protein